jgi:hypothetical protein
MNYYILPKNNFHIKITPTINNDPILPYISFSLIYFLKEQMEQIFKIENEVIKQKKPYYTLEYIIQIVNPYEFIFSNIIDTNVSVCKLKQSSNLFFELLEIFHLYNIKEILDCKKTIRQAHITSKKSMSSSVNLLQLFRENKEDTIIQEEFEHINIFHRFCKDDKSYKIDFFIFECKEEYYQNTSFYIKSVLFILYIILKHQHFDGLCIIKLDNIYYKSIIEVLYILSSLFEKVYILKPLISNITNNERYIVCKHFHNNPSFQYNLYDNILNDLKNILEKGILDPSMNVQTILECEVPYYFINRIEESNTVNGQQQLEGLEQVINIMNNKNKDDKIDKLKKNHIQKCIQWCEKYNIPHNKVIEGVYQFNETNEVETMQLDNIVW